jgi:hypothetical protein
LRRTMPNRRKADIMRQADIMRKAVIWSSVSTELFDCIATSLG